MITVFLKFWKKKKVATSADNRMMRLFILAQFIEVAVMMMAVWVSLC